MVELVHAGGLERRSPQLTQLTPPLQPQFQDPEPPVRYIDHCLPIRLGAQVNTY